MVRVGLLGAGSIANVHAEAYKHIGGARLVAVADALRPAADRLAAQNHLRPYYDMADLLADKDIDMVDVCVPTFLHEQGVVAAAQAGKHVLCEKPIGRNLEEVDRMIAAVRQAHVHAMVGQVLRFWPQYVAIKGILDRGEIGKPLMATARRLSAAKAQGWFRDPALSGGALLDVQVHDFDYIFSLFGKPKTVYAAGLTSAQGAWDHVAATLDYGDKKAICEASYLMPEGYPLLMSFSLLGDKGYVDYRHQGEVVEASVPETRLVVYPSGGQPWAPTVMEEDGYAAEIAYFVNCVNEDKPPAVATLEQARSVLEIALAAKASLETGHVVAL